jgi:hypothetical protein
MPAPWKYLGKQTEEEFLEAARNRFHEGLDSDVEDRTEAQDDIRMVSGGEAQWDPAVLKARKGDGTRPAKPVITYNRLRGPIYQVVNDGRANKPGIIATAEDGGDKDTAEHYFQPRIRQIEYETDADIAYDTCRQQAVSCGRGFIRVRTDFKDYKSFQQIIHIDEIENQFAVVCDPSAIRYDRSDADYWFIFSRLSEDAYKRKYGEEAFDRYSAFTESDSSFSSDWIQSGTVMEVEYWVRTYTEDTLLLLQDGREVLKSELPKGKALKDQINALLASVKRTRKTWVPKVVQYIIDGAQIHDETPWIGSTIPIVPQWGDTMVVDGKRRTYSLIRDSKGPQKLVNLTASQIAELTSNISKTKYAVAEGQLAGHEDEWSPSSPHLYKQYKLYDSTGRQLPAPVPDQSEAPIQALSVQLGQGIDSIKSGTNIYSASLGDRSNETSGKAINSRKLESDVANFHFHDNEARTRKAIGRILIEIIPKIDKGKEQVPVRNEAGKSKMIPIGQPFKDEKGNEITINPDSIGYGVAVRTGASYTSQRDQLRDVLTNLAEKDQNLMAVAGDVVYRTIDGCEEIAERYEKAVIPPELRPQKEGENKMPPEAQAELVKMQKQIEQMTVIGQMLGEKLQKAEADLKSKTDEIESREKVAAWQEETKRAIALADREVKTGIELLKQEIIRIQAEQEQSRADKEMFLRLLSQAKPENAPPNPEQAAIPPAETQEMPQEPPPSEPVAPPASPDSTPISGNNQEFF